MSKQKSIISALSQGQKNQKNLQATLVLSNGERHPLIYDSGKYAPGILRVPGSYELDGAKLLSFRAHILTNRPKLVCRALGMGYPHSSVLGV